MDETIGAKGGKNDRRRRMKITKYQLDKLLEFDEEDRKKKKEERIKKKKELERLIRRNDLITFIKIAPIIIFGNIYQTLKNDTPEKKILREYERAKKEDYLSNPYKESKDIFGGVVVVIKEGSTYKIIDSKYPIDEHRFLNIEERLNQKLEYKVKIESFKETKLISEEDKKIISSLSPNELIDRYDERIKQVKKQLEKLVEEYNNIIDEKENIENIDDIDLMIQKVDELTDRLKELKEQEKNLNTNIEFVGEEEKDILLEGEEISYDIDTEIEYEIDEAIKELDVLKEDLEEEKKLSTEKEELNIDEYNKRQDSFEEINASMLMFLEEQEQLIKRMNEKLSQDINYQDKLNVRFETISESTQRTLETARTRMNGNGPFALRALSAISTMTLGMARNVLFPHTKTELTKTAIIEDYSKEIENGMSEIENAISSIDKNITEIDDMASELEELYPNYREATDLISNLRNLQSDLKSKKESLIESEKVEENLYQQNNEKILKKHN